MSFFNRNNIPAWATIFNHKEYTSFIEALDRYFRDSLKLDYTIQDGVLNPEKNNVGLNYLGLENLTRLCKQQKISAYPEIIKLHFNNLIETYKFQNEFEKIILNFDQVKRYIAVRLLAKEYLSSLSNESYLSRIFVGELLEVLVFDLPHAIVTINSEQILLWNKTLDEIFTIGQQNVRCNYKTPVVALQLGPKGEVLYSCESDHFFVPNILFDLDNQTGLVGSRGSLVAAPTRNLVLVHPINNLSVIGVINKLCSIVPGIFKSNPGSLTMELYWFMDGQFMVLPFEIDQKQIRFSPPDEFLDVLNNLPAAT